MNSFLRFFVAIAAATALLPWRAAPAQTLSFDRAVVCASGDSLYGWGPRQVVVDARGNTYAAGTFNGTVALGTTQLTATQTYANFFIPRDNFVTKLDAAGRYVWAAQMADNQDASIRYLAVDSIGDVYVTGVFRSYSVRFGSGGSVLYNSSARSEGFVAKLRGATGQWLWARRVGGTGDDQLGALAVTAAGDLYVLGSSGSATADVGPFTLSGPQGFLAKLSPAGTWRWVRPALGGQIFLDPQGGIYLAGTFRAPSASFGTTTLTTQGVPGSPGATTGSELFVAKTDDAGTWHWAVQGDAVTHSNLITGLAVTFDGAGHLYVAGSYASTAARIGATVLPNLSAHYPQPVPAPPVPYTNHLFDDAFVARLDATTGVWDWAVRNGGASDETVYGLAATAQGQVYARGIFTTAPQGAADLALLDGATGAWRSFQWLAPAVLHGLALDGQRRLHLAGSFGTPTATFGPVTLVQAGPRQSTGFLARTGAGPLALGAARRAAASLQVWPNPTGQGVVWVQGPAPGQPVEAFDVLGRAVGRGQMPASGPLRLDLANGAAPGLYLVRGGGQARRLVVTP